MKRISIYLLFFISTLYPLYAQLDEFMIQSYIYNILPANYTPEGLMEELKKVYHFNSVIVNELSKKDTLNGKYYEVEEMYKAAKQVGIPIITGNNTSLFVQANLSTFNEIEAEKDVQKYSGPNSPYHVVGYCIKDEPAIEYIKEVAPSMLFIKNHPYTNDLLRYVNLYSTAVYSGERYREQYVQKYIDTSSPNLLMFDHYPIYSGNNRFFHSLYSMALKSVENAIPFISILTPYKNDEDYKRETPLLSIHRERVLPNSIMSLIVLWLMVQKEFPIGRVLLMDIMQVIISLNLHLRRMF